MPDSEIDVSKKCWKCGKEGRYTLSTIVIIHDNKQIGFSVIATDVIESELVCLECVPNDLKEKLNAKA
ncbi:hypothetical protein LCGC14_0223130 [marine sediment metagenome]|uniref:Uncharacterized protein n=1 Tax=marine sediment metagenome TaxID=412755 RepID=A0A0F9UC19_9ZZZZ|nr:hypothetical protein [bacterium]